MGTEFAGRVPSYLGRVLTAEGVAAGSCFEVAPAVVVSAWHVLDDVGCGELDAEVSIDPLRGGSVVGARVAKVDPLHDLAVLRAESSLGGQSVGLAATDATGLGVGVVVTGVPDVDDPEHTYRYLDAPGVWAGSTTCDDEVPLGRLQSKDLLRGMSGAPVRLVDGDVVVGVVSGRYNSADGWLRDSVWVARVEDLEPLLRDVAPVRVQRVGLGSGPIPVTFTVDDTRVRLVTDGLDVDGAHGGVSFALAERVNEVRQRRAVSSARSESTFSPGEVALSAVGELLAASFLPAEVAGAWEQVVASAEQAHRPVEFGVAAGALGVLPWEALRDPKSARPLALCPLVNIYRQQEAATPVTVPGPLRILVAIASPETGGGELLDYERELRNVLAAVRGARQSEARVRIVPFATTGAIRAALADEPAHVLHLTGHGGPGRFVLEDDDGAARLVDADTFIDEAIPPGRMPGLVTLAACYTAAASVATMESFAGRLLERGAGAVIATETSVTDVYATRLLARVYANLASAEVPEVVAALCDARRAVDAELKQSPLDRDRQLALLDEWATVTVSCDGPTVVPIGPLEGAPAPVTYAVRVGDVLAREAGEFVGRRREQRRWPVELLDTGAAGKVLYGIGGVGKTTLAAELARQVHEREPSRLLVGLVGQLNVDAILARLCSAIRLQLITKGVSGELPGVLEIVARPDLPSTDRLALLRDRVLNVVAMLIVLDNFEDNLTPPDGPGGPWSVTDASLAAFLATLVRGPGPTRLLITSRHPFALPDGADYALEFHQIGPMSHAETRKLMWALPALDRLDAAQAERVWRLVGGHPRALEYLDALLNAGEGRFRDVTKRLRNALDDRLGEQAATRFLQATTLEQALTETAALAADDVLLVDLLNGLDATPGARRFLLGASVYRRPIDRNALLYQVGTPDESAATVPDRAGASEAIQAALDEAGVEQLEKLPAPLRQRLAPHLEVLATMPTPPLRTPYEVDTWIERCQTASLLTVTDDDDDSCYSVHRWTAEAIAERHPDPTEIETAHRAAAEYWQWRVRVWPQDQDADIDDLLEARYHLLDAGDLDHANEITEAAARLLHTRGAWDHEATLIDDTLRRLPDDHPGRPVWYHQLGMVAQARGDYDQAEARYRQALKINERLHDLRGLASGYHQLGVLAQARGDYQEAEARYRQSLEIEERRGNPAGLAGSYHQLGVLAQARGDFQEAEARYRQSLEINERLDDQESLAINYHQLGLLAHLGGDYDEAEALYRQSLEIKERFGNLSGLANSLHQLGMVAQERGDYDEAEAHYRQALEIKERLGNLSGLASGYHQLGILAQLRGDYDQAEARYRQSLEIEERLGNLAGLATSYDTLGLLAQLRGDYDQAEARYREALEIRERLSSVVGLALTLSALGVLASERGNPHASISYHLRALAVRLETEDASGAEFDTDRLREVQQALGPNEFDAVAGELLNAEQLADLNALLDHVGPP